MAGLLFYIIVREFSMGTTRRASLGVASFYFTTLWHVPATAKVARKSHCLAPGPHFFLFFLESQASIPRRARAMIVAHAPYGYSPAIRKTARPR